MKTLLTRFVYWLYHEANNLLSGVLDYLEHEEHKQ